MLAGLAKPVARAVGRVALVQPFSVTSQVELAAQLRRSGYYVVSIVPKHTSRRARTLLLLDRLVFNEVWPMLEDGHEGATVREGAIARILSDPTIDVHAFDRLGAQIAPHREHMGSGLRAGLAPPEWYDKRWMADRLEAMGMPGPKVWDSPVADKFPVVVKARLTSGGQGVRVCQDQEKVLEAWHELGGPEGRAFMQEHVPGQAYSTSGVAKDGELLAFETYKLIKAPGDPLGPSLRQEMVKRPDLDEQVRLFIREVGYTGIFSLQQVEDSDGRGRPFDFNPRSPGSFAALTVAGSRLYSAYVAVLEGVDVQFGRSLAPGTITSSVRLSYVRPWPDRKAFVDWHRYTGRQIRMRRETHGLRFVLWGYAMRTRLTVQGLKMSRSQSSATT